MKIKILICMSILLSACSSTPKENEKLRTTEALYKEDTAYLSNYKKELSLDDAIQIARDKNLDLRIKKLNSEIATLDKKIAFGNFLPSVQVGASYTGMDKNLDLDGGTYGPLDLSHLKFIDKESKGWGASAQMPIFVPSLWFLYGARQKGEDISVMIEDFVDKYLQLEVMGEYYYVLSLETENKTLKAELETAINLKEKGKILLEVEEIMPWEYKKLELNKQNKQYNLNENNRALDIAKMNFMKTLSLNPLTEFSLKNEVVIVEENITLEDVIFKALNQNDMIKITDKKTEISNDMKKIAISNFLPQIGINGGYVSNSNAILSSPDFVFGSISGVLSVFNGFKNVNEYKKAVKNEEISELKLEQEFLKVIVETANAYKEVESSQELMKLTQLNYQAEQGKLKQKTSERSIDEIDEVEYMEAISTYEKSLVQLEQSQFKYRIAQGTLKIAMGENPIKGKEIKGEKND